MSVVCLSVRLFVYVSMCLCVYNPVAVVSTAFAATETQPQSAKGEPPQSRALGGGVDEKWVNSLRKKENSGAVVECEGIRKVMEHSEACVKRSGKKLQWQKQQAHIFCCVQAALFIHLLKFSHLFNISFTQSQLIVITVAPNFLFLPYPHSYLHSLTS